MKKLYAVLCICLLSTSSLYAKVISQALMFEEVEKSIRNGDFSKAQKTIKALKNTIQANNLAETLKYNQLQLWLLMAEEGENKFPGAAIALINDTLKETTAISDFDKKIKSIILEQPDLATTYKYKEYLWEALMERGAINYASKSLGTEASKEFSPQEKAEWGFRKASSYSLLGFYYEADSICTNLMQTTKDKPDLKNLYGRVWALRIENDMSRGNIERAETECDKLIPRLASLNGGNKRSTEFIKLLIIKARIEAYSNNFTRASKWINRAYKYADSKRNIRPGHLSFLEICYYRALYAYENDNQKNALKYQKQLRQNIRRYHEHDQTAYIMLDHIDVYDFTTSSRNDLAVDILSKGFYRATKEAYRAGNDATDRAYLYMYRTAVDFDSLTLAEAILRNKLVSYSNPNTLGKCPKSIISNLTFQHYRLKTGATLGPINQYFQTNWPIITKQYDPRHPNYKEWLNFYADVLQAGDKFNEALATARLADSLILLKDGPKSLSYGAQQVFVSQLFMDKGDYFNARKYIEHSREVLRKGGYKRTIEYVNTLRASARLNILLSNYDDSEDDIDEAIKLKSQLVGQNEVSSSSAFDDLALLYFLQGRFSQSNNFLDAVIFERTNRFGRTWQIIQPLLLKAQISVASGDFPMADKHVGSALSIAKKSYADTSIVVMNCERTKAQIYLQIGDFERAALAFNKSRKQYAKVLGEKHPEALQCEMQYLIAKYLQDHNKEKSYADLNELAKKVKEIYGDDHAQYASVLEHIATISLDMGKLDEASNLLDQAGKIYVLRLSKRSTKFADILLQQGDISRFQGNLKDAETKYERCQSIYRSAFSKTHPRYVLCQARLSRIAAAKNDIPEATKLMEATINNYLEYIRAHFPFLSEREKALYWAQMRPDFELFRYLVVRNSNKDAFAGNKLFADALGTKGLLMMNNRQLRNRIMQSSNPKVREGFTGWLAAREELTAMQARGESEIAIIAKEQDIEAAEKVMATMSETFANYRKERGLTYMDVLSQLKTDEAAVEMLRIEVHEPKIADTLFYVALIMKAGDKSAKLLVLPKGSLLETNGLSLYRNSIKFNQHDNKSYNRYFSEIDHTLGKTKKVYFSPDGVYHLVNLDGLTKQDNTYVGDDVQLVLLNSTREIIKSKSSSDNSNINAMLIGDPTFYKNNSTARTIDALPGAAIEVRSLDSLLKKSKVTTTLLTNNAATENSVRTVNSPTLLHLATHGYFADDDDDAVATASSLSAINAYQAMNNSLMRSGLLLADAGEILKDSSIANPNYADGVLTAYEAQVLNLESTRLVVLSACETGGGKVQAGEGVFGMQRAMTAAGAQVVVMSLFKANDAVTQKLMQQFYQNWLITGEIRESFLQARNTIRKTYPDPSAWAGFIMVGQ